MDKAEARMQEYPGRAQRAGPIAPRAPQTSKTQKETCAKQLREDDMRNGTQWCTLGRALA
eukprot:1492352-Alexandrium_andersonii.AAC.1